jgi:hypothetical protein
MLQRQCINKQVTATFRTKSCDSNKLSHMVKIMVVAVLVSIVPLAHANTIDPTDNVVLQWNDATLEAIRITHPGPPIVARMLAIVNTCTFDAWVAYDKKARGTRFDRSLKVPTAMLTETNKNESIAYAAYRANVDLFPSEKLKFDELLTAQGYDPNNATTNSSTAAGIGNLACNAVLEFRHHDGSNQLGDLHPGAYSDYTGYQPVNTPDQINDPNHWQPLRVSNGQGGFVEQHFIAPHWGNVTPYALRDWDKQVVKPARRELKRRNGRVGPYDVTDPGYREQALEVISYSANLTDQGKVFAEYWADGPSSELPPGHWNLFSQIVAQRDNHSVDEDAKMMFAVSNAIFDASIAIWGAKRKFDYVRPVTAIHYLFQGETINAWAGSGQGTQAIQGENWRPYQAATVVTPPFAEYPSGHSGFSSAGAETLKRITGSDVFGAGTTIAAGHSFVEPGLVPVNDFALSWATFTDAADEAGASRRFGGIHFLDGDLDGRLMGRYVASIAWKKSLYYFGERRNRRDGHDDREDDYNEDRN